MKKYILAACLIGVITFYFLYLHVKGQSQSSSTQSSSTFSRAGGGSGGGGGSTSTVASAQSGTTTSVQSSGNTNSSIAQSNQQNNQNQTNPIPSIEISPTPGMMVKKSNQQTTSSEQQSPQTIPLNQAVSNANSKQASTTPRQQYQDGSFVGQPTMSGYGNTQVGIKIQRQNITAVQLLDFPSNNIFSFLMSLEITPSLKSEVLQYQSPNIDIISGATQTSEAFIESLTSALDQAIIPQKKS